MRSQAETWRGRRAAGRAPHAVLVGGAPGVGKRALAAWLAADWLGTGAGPLPAYPVDVPAHPDLHWVEPPEDKKFVRIEQIRELVAELGLTSHGGQGKVAVIEPADAMTVNAANSLLKTLEEPPGNALLVLVADRPGRMPPTVRSRCQSLSVALPTESESLAWLERLQPAAPWAAALRQAGGAPLAAVAVRERLDRLEAMARDFGGVAEQRASPLDVAARWAKEEPQFVLDWLCRQVQECIRRRVAGAADAGATSVADSVLKRMDSRNLFCYLDTINGLRARPAGSFHVQMTLESLLIDWAGGLAHVGHPDGPAPFAAG